MNGADGERRDSTGTVDNVIAGEPQSLEGAVRQLIELGFKDPLEIARRLESMRGPEWLAAQLAMLSEDLIAEIARKQLGQRRRGYELALKPGQPIAHANMRLVGFWIPAEDGTPAWKAAGEVTPDDLDRRAAWYESFAIGVLRRAQWCRQVAALMRHEGVAVLAQLHAELPSLPEPEPLP